MGSRGYGWSRGGGLIGSNVWVGGDVEYGVCEPRIEGIVQCTKRYSTILRKIKKCGGKGEGQYLKEN